MLCLRAISGGAFVAANAVALMVRGLRSSSVGSGNRSFPRKHTEPFTRGDSN